MRSLAKLLADAGVVKRGKFRLTSGKVANFYIDLKSAYGKPGVFSSLVRALAALIGPALHSPIRANGRMTVIASGGYGGIPLATAVALRLKLPLTLIRDKPKRHGTAQWLDGHVPTSADRIALIDDVYTTGGSLKRMEDALRPTHARVIGRFVVVNRSASHPGGVRFLLHAKALLSPFSNSRE